jgi:hypothetical protein
MSILRAPIRAAAAALVLAGGVAIPSGAWADSAETLLYERTLMDRAGARCHLFSPDIAAALSAAGTQARGAVLRGGGSAAGVRQIEDRAALKAYAVPCASPDLATAATRVRRAFDGYADLRFMRFPGSFSPWQAERKPWPLVVKGKVQPGPRWRLTQTAQSDAGVVTFGMADGPELVVVTTAGDAGRAAGARLLLRDPAKAADPFLDPRRPGLLGRVPPRALTQAFLARSLGPAPASLSLGGGTELRFSADAAQALAMLDPREAATVELVFPTRTGERVETAIIEVGDFAAARAFLAVGR